ncbi:MAG: hypothetical protein QW343_00095 [Candidatus Norongarragalinales archaeon]
MVFRMPVASAMLARERGFLTREFKEIPVEERAWRAVRPLLSLGERSFGEAEFEMMRADEAEIQAAIKAGNLLPYIEFRNARSAELEAKRRELLKQDFSEWRHAVLFEEAVRARLTRAQQERSLSLFRAKARELLARRKRMESILASNGAYYGNRSAASFWASLNEWCRAHLASLQV